MSETTELPPRPDEDQLSELVWAHNPTLSTEPKQMTRAKLHVLRHSYVETDPPEWAREDVDVQAAAQDEQAAALPPAQVHGAAAENTTAPLRPSTRRSGDLEQKEQS